MRVSMFEPSRRLAPFIRRLSIIEADAATTRTLVPDAGINLAFRYRGFAQLLDGNQATHLPDTAISGLRDTPRRMLTSAGGGAVIVTLREGQAPAFFPEPIHELHGTTICL